MPFFVYREIRGIVRKHKWDCQEAQVTPSGGASEAFRNMQIVQKMYIDTIQSNISRVTFDEKWGIICWMSSFSAFYIFSFLVNIITLPPQNLMFFKYFAPKSYSLSRRCNCMYILKMITQLQIIAYNLKLKKWRKFYYLQSQCSLLW